MYDILIKNGYVYDSNGGFSKTNLGIDNGKIEYVGKEELEAKQIISAEGKYVVPGAIDPHTHFGIYEPWEKDFYSESRAAATGGITTVINFYREKESYLNTLPELIKRAEENSIIDFGLHLGLLTDNHINELKKYTEDLGPIC